jgi:hypothetical protein
MHHQGLAVFAISLSFFATVALFSFGSSDDSGNLFSSIIKSIDDSDFGPSPHFQDDRNHQFEFEKGDRKHSHDGESSYDLLMVKRD